MPMAHQTCSAPPAPPISTLGSSPHHPYPRLGATCTVRNPVYRAQLFRGKNPRSHFFHKTFPPPPVSTSSLCLVRARFSRSRALSLHPRSVSCTRGGNRGSPSQPRSPLPMPGPNRPMLTAPSQRWSRHPTQTSPRCKSGSVSRNRSPKRESDPDLIFLLRLYWQLGRK